MSFTILTFINLLANSLKKNLWAENLPMANYNLLDWYTAPSDLPKKHLKTWSQGGRLTALALRLDSLVRSNII